MVSVCFYFQVHQPYRIKNYTIFDIGQNHNYFDEKNSRLDNEATLQKVSQKCYLPMNKLMLQLLEKHPSFKVSYSFSGMLLEQLEKYNPKALESFQKLIDTGKVEVLSETYYHSLSFLYSKKEFEEQVKLHRKKIFATFKTKPKIFRNTELIYNNELAKFTENMGYKGILAEGVDSILGWRSPNFIYKPAGTKKMSLLLKNYKLSDDIAFRFSSRNWKEWPLTAPKYAKWISSINGNGSCVNLFMDYETFGEHQWQDTGIFNFMEHLPKEILKHPDNDFKTPTELIKDYKPVAEIDIPHTISWADIERDLSAWLGNKMQKYAIAKLYELEKQIKKTKNKKVLEDWRKLQTSDIFYYMCTKWFADGDVHKYFNPYETPYDCFINFMNILNDLTTRTKK